MTGYGGSVLSLARLRRLQGYLGLCRRVPGALYPVFFKALSFEMEWLTFAYNKPASGHNTKHYECNILCFLF